MAKSYSDWVAALTPYWFLLGLDPNFKVTSGSRVLADALSRRFTTLRETLIGPPGAPEPNEGYDVRQHLNDKINDEKEARIASFLSLEALKDERVSSANTTVSMNVATSTLTIKITGVGAGGPFAMTLGVGDLTVDIINESALVANEGDDYGTDIATFPEGGLPPLPDDGNAYQWGERWVRAVYALPIDLLITAAKLAVKARIISIAPDDAIPRHAADRMIDGVPGESVDALRIRVQGAWSTWSTAGTALAEENALALFGCSDVRIYAQQATGSPTKIDKLVFDPNPSWSRFWIFIYPPHPWTAPHASDSDLASEDTVAGVVGMSQVQYAAIYKQVHQWRSAHGLAVEMFVVFDETLDPTDIITMVETPTTLDDERFVDLPMGQLAGWGAAQFADDDLRAGYYEPLGSPF